MKKIILAVAVVFCSIGALAQCSNNVPPTYTPNLNLEIPATNSCNWQTPLNLNWGILDTSVASKAPIANPAFTGNGSITGNFAAGSTVTATSPQYNVLAYASTPGSGALSTTSTGTTTSGSTTITVPGANFTGTAGQLFVCLACSINSIAGPVTVGNGGNNYSAGDVLNLVQGAAYGGQWEVDTVSGGVIQTGHLIQSGANYTIANGVTTSGGTGSGATLNILNINQAGMIYKSLKVTAAGNTYTTGDLLTLSQSGASGGTWQVDAVAFPLSVSAAGTGYVTGPAQVTGGNGQNMTVQVTASSGNITALSVLGPGNNTYLSNDVVNIVQAGASGGTGTVTALTGPVLAGHLVTYGTGYTSASGVATTGGTGSGCTLQIQAVQTGTDLNTTIVSGTGTTAVLAAAPSISYSGNAVFMWGPDIGVALQAAVNAANAIPTVNTHRSVPDVLIPQGSYLMATPVTWGDNNFVGTGSMQYGAQIYWAGNAGAVPFTKSAYYSGFGNVENLGFIAPSLVSNYPLNWFVYNTGVDNDHVFHNVHLANTQSHAIWNTVSWVNAHYDWLRGDAIGGCLIMNTVNSSSSSLAAWSVENSTEDFGLGGGVLAGYPRTSCVYGFDNTVGASFYGTISVSGTASRYEGEQPVGFPFGFIYLIGNSNSGGQSIALTDLDIAYAYNYMPWYLVYSTNTGGTFTGNLYADRVKTDANLGAVMASAGGWSGGAAPIPIPSQHLLRGINVDSQQKATFEYNLSKMFVTQNSASSTPAFSTWFYTDVQPRFECMINGTCYWGSGGVTAPDTYLGRLSAGVLGINGSAFAQIVSTTGTNCASASLNSTTGVLNVPACITTQGGTIYHLTPNGTATYSASSTYYSGNGVVVPSTVYSKAQIYVEKACTVGSVTYYANCSGAPTGGTCCQVTVDTWQNNTTSIGTSSQNWTSLGSGGSTLITHVGSLSTPLAVGDLIETRVQTPAWSTAPTSCMVTETVECQ